MFDNKKKDYGLIDKKLWVRLQGGCKKSLEELYFRYYNQLFRYALGFSGKSVLAEDQVQSLFLKIWDRKEFLGEVKHVRTYLWISLRRSLIDEQRRKKRFSDNIIELRANNFQFISSAEELLINQENNNEIREGLYNAIQKLHPRQREILYLKFFEGLNYQEIEEITSLKYQSIRNYIYEALKSLKKALGENGDHSNTAIRQNIPFGLFCGFLFLG